MAIIKGAKVEQDQSDVEAPEQSIIVSNSRIDKNGVAWIKKPIWLRQDYVNKLKVISHFQGKTTQQLLDSCLGELIKRVWDNTAAREEMVGKTTGKVKIAEDTKP